MITDREQLLPNPFTTPAPPPLDPRIADAVAAIERELQAFLDRPPLFLRDKEMAPCAGFGSESDYSSAQV